MQQVAAADPAAVSFFPSVTLSLSKDQFGVVMATEAIA